MAVKPHVLYENFVLEDMLNELLDTKLNAMNLMQIDNELAQNPGMIKKVLVYDYEGEVEELTRGAANKDHGVVSHKAKQYEVLVSQHTFKYADEDVMLDPKVIEYGVRGAASKMVNFMNEKYFKELSRATLVLPSDPGEKINYNLVVDAMAKMELNGGQTTVQHLQGTKEHPKDPVETNWRGAMGEDASAQAFILINPKQRADLRKDPDFKAANHGEILFTGQIGQVAGLPVIVSALVPDGEFYVATRAAVTCFVKKEAQVEQDRDIEHRENTMVFRKVNVVALTDATQVVKVTLTDGE